MRYALDGWRRKIGCGILALALITSIAWLRSMVLFEEFALRIRNRPIAASSMEGQLTILWNERLIPIAPTWTSRSIHQMGLPEYRDISLFLKEYVAFGSGFTVPYWRVALPLWLATAYLLFWPLRIVHNSKE